MEKQWKLAEDEVGFLRSVLTDANVDFQNYKLKEIYKDREPSRLEEIQGKLKISQKESSELEKHVQYWTNVSKKSQEAKLVAEASQTVLKKELEELKHNFKSGSNQKNVIDELRVQLQSKEEELLKYADTDLKITKFSSDLEEAYSSAEKLERENQSLKDNLEIKEKLIFDLKEQLTLFIDKEESLNNVSNIEENYKNLLKEKSDLEKEKEVLGNTLDSVNGKRVTLEKENNTLSKNILDKDQELSVMEADLKEYKLLNQKLNQEREDLDINLKRYAEESSLLKYSLLQSESIIQDLEAKLNGVNLSEKDNAIDQEKIEKAEIEVFLGILTLGRFAQGK